MYLFSSLVLCLPLSSYALATSESVDSLVIRLSWSNPGSTLVPTVQANYEREKLVATDRIRGTSWTSYKTVSWNARTNLPYAKPAWLSNLRRNILKNRLQKSRTLPLDSSTFNIPVWYNVYFPRMVSISSVLILQCQFPGERRNIKTCWASEKVKRGLP